MYIYIPIFLLYIYTRARMRYTTCITRAPPEQHASNTQATTAVTHDNHDCYIYFDKVLA